MKNFRKKLPYYFVPFVRLKGVCFIFIFSLFSFALSAQVTSKVDTTLIRIGEQITYTIAVEADSTALVLFPEGQSFSPLEVIESYKVDSSFANSKLRLIKKYGLTQFDSGVYKLPSQRVMIDDRAFSTDSSLVEVRDIIVDTTQQKMFDIKPAITVSTSSFNFTFLLYILLALLIIGGVIFYFFRRKKIREEREKQLPPYEEAMVSLEKLDGSELLKNDKAKAYYSALTEIVKRYIDREVDDKAIESTTDELIERLQLHKDSGHFNFDITTLKKLEAILKRADLVKFAKMKQDFGQARSDRTAIEEIINETKEALPEPTEEELLENEAYLELQAKRKRKKKIITASAFLLSAVISFGLVYGFLNGFDTLKDKIFGNEMRELSEARWYKSEYGNPSIIIETPEILKRVQDSVPPELAMAVKSNVVFTEGGFKDPFFVSVASIQLQPTDQEIDLNLALDNTLNELEKRGAKNLIVKREEFQTEAGIKGIKAYGDFNVQISENKMLKNKHTYELLLFAQQGGIQTILVAYEDDGTYAQGLKERIINSVELEISSPAQKQAP